MAANKVTVSSPGPSGPAGIKYEGTWVTSTAYQYRDVVLYSTDANLYHCDVAHTAGSITPGNPGEGGVTYWSLFIPSGDALNWATYAKHSQLTDSVGNVGYSALHQAGKALDWATKVDGVVTNDADDNGIDGSAKAWSIGGTGVSQTALKGSAKDWATKTDGVVDDASHSAKAWTIGGTGITGQASAGAAKDWSTKVDGTVDNANHSAKAWSVGGTGVTTTASAGPSKDWATKVNGAVDTSDFSSKAWSVGGTGVTTTASKGAAKEWATSTGAQVDTSEYSSKEYAIGNLTASGGSAKAWAVDASSPNGLSDKSANTLATEAATSATNASASEAAAKLSASSVASAFDSFNDTYLGKSSDAVVLTASSSSGLLITSAAHGLVDTQVIRVVNSGGGLPGNLSAGTDYYVRDKTTNNFKLATSSGGTAIAYSSAGSGTNTWYYADFATPSSSSWAKNGSTITVASNVGVRVGQVVTGSGIPSSPTKPNVLSIDGTAIVISENMAAAGSSVAVTFQNRGVYGAFDTTKDGPSTDNDGDSLADGMLYFNTTDNAMMVYKTTGSAWVPASSSGSVSLIFHKFTASGSETSIAAASFSPTLSYTPTNIIVFLNGVSLDTTDYTATSGSTITGLSALAASDEVVVAAFKSFEVSDNVSAGSGGTFGGDVTHNGNVIMATSKKIQQKGAFMQSSTHQALFLGA